MEHTSPPPAYPPDGEVEWRPPAPAPVLSWDRGGMSRAFPPDGGPDRARELAVLLRLGVAVPLPEALPTGDQNTLRMSYVPGEVGQRWMLDAGGSGMGEEDRAARLAQQAGGVLGRLHRLGREPMADHLSGTGPVVVHGDYGPFHMIVDPAEGELRAVLGWDGVRFGEPVEDLAWFEWNLRIWCASPAPAVRALYAGYGSAPDWADRHRAMLDRCRRHVEVAEGAGFPNELADRWVERDRRTRGFAELLPLTS